MRKEISPTVVIFINEDGIFPFEGFDESSNAFGLIMSNLNKIRVVGQG